MSKLIYYRIDNETDEQTEFYCIDLTNDLTMIVNVSSAGDNIDFELDANGWNEHCEMEQATTITIEEFNEAFNTVTERYNDIILPIQANLLQMYSRRLKAVKTAKPNTDIDNDVKKTVATETGSTDLSQ